MRKSPIRVMAGNLFPGMDGLKKYTGLFLQSLDKPEKILYNTRINIQSV